MSAEQHDVARRISRRSALRRIAAGTAAVAVVREFGFPAVARAQKSLVVCGWGGTTTAAQREVYFRPFEKESGLKVVEASPTNYPKLKAMVESGNVEWDVVDTADRMIFAGMKENLFEKLDVRAIDVRKIDPRHVTDYGVGHKAWSTLLSYSTRKYQSGNHPKSWAEFYDAAKFPAARSLRNAAFDNLEIALMADGVPFDRIYPIDVDRAFQVMGRIKPHVKFWWQVDAQPVQLLTDGEIDLTTLSAARIIALRDKEGAKADCEWNQGIVHMDWWTVPRGARNKEAAMQFINFAIQAKQQAAISNQIPFGPTNRDALGLLKPEVLRNLPTSPENLKRQLVSDRNWYGEHLSKVEERMKAWLLS
jgi:putative spermidine/putrescine transport system substrate-binding protein